MFNSPEQALRFAFKVRDKTIISQAHNVFQIKDKSGKGNREAMTAYDFHAQGALIIGFVEKMGKAETAWMYWMYGDAREREYAARVLADGYAWMGVGLERGDIYKAMIAKSVRRCAEDIAVSKTKAWRLRRKILDALSPVERRVLDTLWDRLEPSN
jgi:hypothetical protein